MEHKIPRIFHFVYGLKKQTHQFHIAHYLCLESCLQVNQPDQIYFYYHYEPFGPYWRKIRDKLTPVKVDLVDFVLGYPYSAKYMDRFNYAHQSDFIRLEKLAELGGVYADIDTLFVNPLPELLYRKPFVMGREGDVRDEITAEVRPSLCNALIMSEPKSKFIQLWLENIQKNFDGTWSRHSTLLPYDLSQRYPDLIHVEPIRSFYPFLGTKEDLFTLFEDLERDLDGVYSIHLWEHQWWESEDRYFTDFHKGLLTEAFIRDVDTTYNVLARTFLPDRPVGGQPFYLEISTTIRETPANLRTVFKKVKRFFYAGVKNILVKFKPL